MQEQKTDLIEKLRGKIRLKIIALSSNGRTPVFGAGDSGSNPFEATNVKGVRWQKQRQ